MIFRNVVISFLFYFIIGSKVYASVPAQADSLVENFQLLNKNANQDWLSKIDLKLLEQLIKNKINNYRIKNGVDEFEKNDTIMQLAYMEAKFSCDHDGAKYEDLIDELNGIYGNKVYSSYNASLLTFWYLNSITDWSNVEDRMAEGYLLRFFSDKKESALLVKKNRDGKKFFYHWGISAQIKGDTL